MQHKKVQTVIFAKHNNKYYGLLLQTNKLRKEFWQNVTGSVDLNEEIKDAALREAVEETGLSEEFILKFEQIDLNFQFLDQWDKNIEEFCFFILCSKQFTVKIDRSEHQDFKWEELSVINESSFKFESNFQAFEKAKEKILYD
ncbi:MAG: 8-oxo-dGTP pyrophosphatase MutT (NUDIX family) [Thermoproteota archaeon]|jgi:8-oxo-dGTP pyrophosphatase MutT (NUDIX family)